MYRVHLTDEQHQQLKQRTRAPRISARLRDRLETVRLSDGGLSVPRIARHLRTNHQPVRHWVKRFLEGGFDALLDQPYPGRPDG